MTVYTDPFLTAEYEYGVHELQPEPIINPSPEVYTDVQFLEYFDNPFLMGMIFGIIVWYAFGDML